MPVSEGCLRENKRFAVICLENSKHVVDEFNDFISMTHFPTPCTYQEMGSCFLNTGELPTLPVRWHATLSFKK